MKRAILYARVSTDDQADRGYSLGVQQEQLRKYCELKGIEIIFVYVEDHSAKTFNRPKFQEFLKYAKTNYKNIDLLLFVSWDRFSRNVTDAYEMLAKLKNWNIESQSITQPIDWKIPENKIMLAIYLTLPEVDNDNRSIKVRSGIRGANKLGRWTSTAPLGYINRRDEQNKPIIIPSPQSTLIAWGFEEIRKGRPMDIVRKELNQKRVKVSKSQFTRLLRNPVYMGKLFVKGLEDEPEQIVEGHHEGIISEELFYAVQNVIEKRTIKLNKHHSFKDRDELPLRGLLCCSKCGNHVTGSASKSKTGARHFYYHCSYCKQERFRADKANIEMEALLSSLNIVSEAETLYEIISEDFVKENPKQEAQKQSVLANELSKLKEREEKLQNTFLEGHLSAQDYTQLKRKLEEQLHEVKQKISDGKNEKKGRKEELKQASEKLPNLLERYRNSNVQEKKDLISSIFPKKFIFCENEVRTQEIDAAVALIIEKTKVLAEGLKQQAKYALHLLHLVAPTGIEPISKV